MIALEFEDALDLLNEHGIHVGPGRAVENIEDAVAFAADRPIDLFLSVPFAESHPARIVSNLRTPQIVGHAYRMLEAQARHVPAARILARRVVDAGNDVAVDAREDGLLGKVIEIRDGSRAACRLHPLGAEQAEAMLAEFGAPDGNVQGKARTRRLAHLLVRVSGVLDVPGVERVTLDPVRVCDDSYHVLGARIASRRDLRLDRSVDGRAHERSAFHASRT
jgi:hypothetical protein